MSLTLRPLEYSELPAASQLCLRSKAYWGYDQEFLDACKAELTLNVFDLQNDPVILAEDDQGMAGIAHVSVDDSGCYLEKLFVDTDRIGRGVGRVLFSWALDAARGLGAHELIIEADPDAAPFYQQMGCIAAGQTKSGSILDRYLPRFVHSL